MTGPFDPPPFRLEEYLGVWEFSAKHHLTASDAETLTIEELLGYADAEERERFRRLPLSYAPTWGGEELRAAIAELYEGLGPEHVLTFAGAEEALFWALQELAGPGDHALVTVPNYQSFETIPLTAGVEVEGIVLDPAAGWEPDVADIARRLRPTTKLVAVNFPNNPTGAICSPETWRALVELCEEHGATLLADEVYRGLETDEARRLPQAAELSPAAVSLNVMSKSYGLPGLRIGWLATRRRRLLERLERRKHYTSICNATPSEALATIALRNGAAIQGRNRDLIATNIPLFEALFAQHPEKLEWEAPAGGCVSFPRYPGDDGVETFCRDLVETEGVVLLPASVFASELGPVPTDRFRIGVGRRDPEAGLAALGRFLGE
ncbi:MAG TPA: aminotransferase class I/II-fold pyridoxal phosphate-dependent enzyme [Solirubrobacterales bacterium]|nr:aminotransferase class I/II-fold pyridoxal phosphate-dependent enzyme [Solirubrobacterales bacterium]